MRAYEFITERKKRKRKRSNKYFGGYWYPGYGYYGSGAYGGESGNSGGGDGGGGESVVENSNTKIDFKIQKGPNKFQTTLMIGDTAAGIYQYDSASGRSIAEIQPEFQGQGLGKLLVLHAINTAANLGMDFVEDESRTAAYDNVLDSLESSGYIISDDGYLYITNQGLQYLQQSLKQDLKETVIGPDDLVDVFIRGKHHGETMTRLVVRAFPNKNIPMLIRKLENKYGINPNAIVYGPSRYVKEAKPIAPLVVPTPAQDSVEKSVKAINQIDRVLNLIDIKKSSIEQEIANIKDKIEALKYGPPPGSQTVKKDKGWVGRDKEGNPIAGGPIDENFADGRVKGKSRPGRVKRAGASCAGSVSELRARAKKYGGERGRMYHWCANMKGGRSK